MARSAAPSSAPSNLPHSPFDRPSPGARNGHMVARGSGGHDGSVTWWRHLLAAMPVVAVGLLARPTSSPAAVALASPQRLVEQPRVAVGDSNGDGLPEA